MLYIDNIPNTRSTIKTGNLKYKKKLESLFHFILEATSKYKYGNLKSKQDVNINKTEVT